MKSFSNFLDERCWPGHKPVPGKKPYSPGSCVKEEDMEEDWSQKYKGSIDCNNPKGFSQKAHCAGKKKNESVNEDLRNWFSKTSPKGDWKRINSKGEAIGPCAREPGEPKPKCMSAEKRASLTKKERASAVRAKRKHDPNPERKGEPINVSNFGKGKISEDMEQLDEKNVPTNPELWSRAKSLARSKFDVYPSAYANGWASKWYKGKGGGWRAESTVVDDAAKFIQEKQLKEDWNKINKQDKTDGLSQKAVNAYRRENPGSKLKTAVTEKNPTGKRASRRQSFCSRMGGMKKRLTNPENARDPDSPINKALRRWNC